MRFTVYPLHKINMQEHAKLFTKREYKNSIYKHHYVVLKSGTISENFHPVIDSDPNFNLFIHVSK